MCWAEVETIGFCVMHARLDMEVSPVKVSKTAPQLDERGVRRARAVTFWTSHGEATFFCNSS